MQLLFVVDRLIQKVGLDKLVDHVIPHIVANAADHEVWAKGPIKPQGVACGYWGTARACGSCYNPGQPNNWGKIQYHYTTDSGNCDWGWPICSGCRGGTQDSYYNCLTC